MRLSVSIICSNNEGTIGRVLESIAEIADEIIVIVDTNSTDNTFEICQQFTDQVSVEEWRGFLNQKNEALRRCSGDWILDLDSDEVVTPELKKEIIEAISSNQAQGYFLNRRTFYVGKYMHFAWQPDWRLRLVKKDAQPKWGGDAIHSLLFVEGETARLKSHLDHFSYKDVDDHMRRILQYAKGVAKNRYKSGKRFSLFKALTAPLLAFGKQYLLKRGFLDGFRGFIAAFSSGMYSFLKNVYLWEIAQNETKPK